MLALKTEVHTNIGLRRTLETFEH